MHVSVALQKFFKDGQCLSNSKTDCYVKPEIAMIINHNEPIGDWVKDRHGLQGKFFNQASKS